MVMRASESGSTGRTRSKAAGGDRWGRARGQALVEFALVAPLVLLLIGGAVDLGRGMLLYDLLNGASRDTARLAALSYNSGSNTLPPDCTTLAPPCKVPAVITGAHALDPLGVPVVYATSNGISAAPWYGTYTANPDPTLPGKLTLSALANANTVYVFIYELDRTPGNATPRWNCRTIGCTTTNGSAVRTPGHQRVVVDLKLRWRPVLATILGLPSSVTFDSQSVSRIEF